MAWPPASNLATGLGYLGSLPVTLAWGTDGLYTEDGVSVIVLSIRPAQMVEEIPIENGSGVVSTQVLIVQGQQVEITVLDDRSVTAWPKAGQVITVLSPLPSGAAATSTNYEVVDNSYQGSRKAPGERTILAKVYTLITPANITGA